MKKIKIIIILLMIFNLSCENATKIEQEGIIVEKDDDKAIKTVDDILLGVNALYGQLDITVDIQLNGSYADELGIGFANGGQNLDELGLNITATNGKAASIWVSSYIGIAQVNRLLDSAALITPDEEDQGNYDNALAQAYAIRAFLHLRLQTYFTTDYTDDNALGVAALDFVPELEEYYPRNTNGEVFQFIEDDLDRADALFNDTNFSTTFISPVTILAMRARMAAYRQDYVSADDFASQVLGRVTTNISTQAWSAMWDNSADGDMILKFERRPNDSYSGAANGGGGFVGSLYAFSRSNATGAVFLEMGRSLYNTLKEIDDIRLERYVDETSIINPSYSTAINYSETDVLVIDKYPGSEGLPLMNDIPVFRAAEMLLIRAEAAAINGNNLAGAASLIKSLRDARSTTGTTALPTYANEEEAFKDILLERRVELAFEGHRWVDLKRLGQLANESIDKDPRDCEITGGCTLPVGSFKYTLPIPLREIELNSLLVQNPNY